MKVVISGDTGWSMVNLRGVLIYTLISRGHEVSVIVGETDETSSGYLYEMGVSQLVCPFSDKESRLMSDNNYKKQLKKALKAWRPDVILAYSRKPITYGLTLANELEIPTRYALIAGVRDAFLSDDPNLSRVVRNLLSNLYRKALANATHVFFHNQEDYKFLYNSEVIESDLPHSFVEGSGIDLDYYYEKEADPENVERVERGELIFLMLAQTLRDAGVSEFASAARSVKSKHPDCRFLLVGNIEFTSDYFSENDYYQWIQEGVLEHYGFLDDNRTYYHMADVFVLPSYQEGTPLFVLEALATGLPVITTDAPGCRQTIQAEEFSSQVTTFTIKPGANGYLVHPRSSAAIEHAMKEFIHKPHLVARKGNASRKHAEERFDVHTVNEAMLNVMGL